MRVFSSGRAIIIDGFRMPIGFGTLSASFAGSTVSIVNAGNGEVLVSALWSAITDGGNNGFASSDDAMAYLNALLTGLPPAQIFATSSFVAAAPVFGGYAVMFAGVGQVEHADPSAPGYVFAGIATQAAAAGARVAVQKRDVFSFSAWSWAPGEPVFALPGGLLTQTPPDSGVVHQIGAALDPTTVSIEPRDPVYL